jgi:diadenosine tetraphosphate (Ap4A) HIT family hydrolase
MMRRILFCLVASCLAGLAARADMVTCTCDVAHPETLAARQCSLCREAEKQPADVKYFFLKDANPSKPNRWLALARSHERSIDLLTDTQRTELLAAAIDKAKQLFGDEWAIAYNAPSVQTQCHIHLHIGKLIPGVESGQFITATKVEDIPAPAKGEGFWIHPQGNLFHVHMGEQITETVLER